MNRKRPGMYVIEVRGADGKWHRWQGMKPCHSKMAIRLLNIAVLDYSLGARRRLVGYWL